MQHKSSCCYLPTTVVLVDDDKRLLEFVGFKLGRHMAYKSYTDPFEAVDFLTTQYQPDPFTKRCLLRPEEAHRDHRNIDIDIVAIHQEIYNPNRFNEIAVIVVDYAMPAMNGLDFCQQLKGNRFKIILLTGEADERVATELFNKGVIHRFIRKDAHNFTDILTDAIRELQQDYFQELSEIVINGLTKNPDYPPCCLDDPIFINFFDAFCQQHKLAEYYLLEASGSFLFLDADAKPSLLIVKDNDEMEGALCDAELSDIDAPPEVLEAIKNKTKLLHRYTEEEYSKPPTEWLSLLYPAKKLEGRTTYYYAYVDDSTKCPVEASKILSYKAYLNKL